MRTYFSVVGLLIMLAAPLCAQNEKDVAAYLGSVLSTPGAAATLAESPLLGDKTNAWGIAPFYTHVDLGDFGDLSAIGLDGSLSANVFGGTLYASGIGGHLALAVTGAYLNPSCPDGIDCEGFATIGGSGTVRLLRAAVATDSGARITLSLRGAGGYAFAPGSDRYQSASLGVPLALSLSLRRNLCGERSRHRSWIRISAKSSSTSPAHAPRFLVGSRSSPVAQVSAFTPASSASSSIMRGRNSASRYRGTCPSWATDEHEKNQFTTHF
jgi:hypothetical protein